MPGDEHKSMKKAGTSFVLTVSFTGEEEKDNSRFFQNCMASIKLS